MSAMGRYDDHGSKVKQGQEEARGQGKHVGRPPWGLNVNPNYGEPGEPHLVASANLVGNNGEDGMEPSERLRQVIKTVVDMRKDGSSYARIAAWLNAEGVPTSSGKEDAVWSGQQVSYLLGVIEAGTYEEWLG